MKMAYDWEMKNEIKIYYFILLFLCILFYVFLLDLDMGGVDKMQTRYIDDSLSRGTYERSR